MRIIGALIGNTHIRLFLLSDSGAYSVLTVERDNASIAIATQVPTMTTEEFEVLRQKEIKEP